MTQDFNAHNVNRSKLISELKSFGIEIQENQLDHFLSILSITSDETVVKRETKWPKCSPGVMAMMVPTTSYYIRTKRAALVLAATLLDAAGLAGLASASLAISGISTKSLVKLSQENGEYCILTHADHHRKNNCANINPKKIRGIIYGNRCPFNGAGCKFMIGINCGIQIRDIKNIYKQFSQKEILSKKSGDWQFSNKI